MALDLPSYLLGKSKGGGGGGTTNYNSLTNKPSINGVTLSGDKTAEDLGIIAGDGFNTIDYNILGQLYDGMTLQELIDAFGTEEDLRDFFEDLKSQKPLFVINAEEDELTTYYNVDYIHYSYLEENDGEDNITYGIELYQPSGTSYQINLVESEGVFTDVECTVINALYATEEYVNLAISNAIGNINTVLATLTTPNNGGN